MHKAGLYAIVILVSMSGLQAQENPKSEKAEDSLADQALKLVSKEVLTYDLYLGTERKNKLALLPKSVLRWSNPVSGQLYGEVFVWTEGGRPRVLASAYKWFSPHTHIGIEFHSLAPGKMIAIRENSLVWHPQQAGLEMSEVSGASAPASSKAGRLRQMRQLARQFEAHATDRNKPEVHEQLRLLSKPIYRYRSEDPAIIDGALFAFVQGTNPEVILVVEAHRTGEGDQWQYGLVRQNSVRFDVKRNDKLIWTVPKIAPPWENMRDRNKAYTSFRRETEQP